jgi:nucleoside 2-deoxyribosyltransferase
LAPEADRAVRVYFAAPLFTQAERRWNRELARQIESELGCTVVLPQDICVGGKKNAPRHFAQIHHTCIEGVKSCDAMVAILDGADADSGTAFEVGYAYALGKPVIAVRTDYRKQQERGTNLMLARGCQAYVSFLAFNEDVAQLGAEVARKLRILLRSRR